MLRNVTLNLYINFICSNAQVICEKEKHDVGVLTRHLERGYPVDSIGNNRFLFLALVL